MILRRVIPKLVNLNILSIRSHSSRNITKSIYRQCLTHRFDSLSKPLQVFHSIQNKLSFHGNCNVVGSTSILAKLIRLFFQFPEPADNVQLIFELDANSKIETWKRNFIKNGKNLIMISTQEIHENSLCEKLGPIDVYFDIEVLKNGDLSLKTLSVTLFQISIPTILIPIIKGIESADENKLYFDVSVTLPFIGLLFGYKGHLNVENVTNGE